MCTLFNKNGCIKSSLRTNFNLQSPVLIKLSSCHSLITSFKKKMALTVGMVLKYSLETCEKHSKAVSPGSHKLTGWFSIQHVISCSCHLKLGSPLSYVATIPAHSKVVTVLSCLSMHCLHIIIQVPVV